MSRSEILFNSLITSGEICVSIFVKNDYVLLKPADLYHKPHEENSPIKRKIKLEMFNVMPFLKIRGMFPLLYENYAHDNHKGSGKKCSPKVLWHLKEADLSHSLG